MIVMIAHVATKLQHANSCQICFFFFVAALCGSNQVCLPLLSPRLDSTVVASLGLAPCRVIVDESWICFCAPIPLSNLVT